MSLVARLARFADSASLGEMRVGASIDDVARFHGEYFDGPTLRRKQWPRLFGFGDVELYVCRCRRVNMICIQTWRDETELPYEERAGCETFPGQPTYDEVTEALDAAGVGWCPYPSLTLPGQTAIIADVTAVSFVFVLEDGDPPLLNAVGAPGDFHECPKGPQHHPTRR
ncbi:hypothetical protein [Catenulispora rubra]|uniref:hypothetical protein n=1 Tax=Catenulispora rubra TaxID=280293 RepID=UPI0018921B19|nr:hypothetical protein [Catenulispora rubra]